MKPRVWLIQTGEPVPDGTAARRLRTSILADRLVQRGCDVTWWTSAFDHFKKTWVFKRDAHSVFRDGMTLIPLKGCGYSKNVSLARFCDHRLIASKFKGVASLMCKPDIIVASMPAHDLAYAAVSFAKKNDVPVIVDIRDCWPDVFLAHFPASLQTVIRWALCMDYGMVKDALSSADGLIGATDTFLDWGLRYAGRDRAATDRVFFLGAQRNPNPPTLSEKMRALAERLRGKFVVTFIGSFAHAHNPSILLACAKRMKDTNILFVLAGAGEFNKTITKEASAHTNVFLPGWLDQEEISVLLAHSHVGCCPTTRSLSLFPNKAFTYLSAGLPLVSAFCGDLKSVIEKYRIGFYYPPNDVDRFCECIGALHRDSAVYKMMRDNAVNLFNKEFSADRIYDDYAQYIEDAIVRKKEGR